VLNIIEGASGDRVRMVTKMTRSPRSTDPIRYSESMAKLRHHRPSPRHRRPQQRRRWRVPPFLAGKAHPSKSRLWLVWAILVAIFLGLGVRLFHLQVRNAIAEEPPPVIANTTLPRRAIEDRNGNLLALDRPVYELYAHPHLFERSLADMAAALAPVLDRPPASILAQLSSAPSGIRLASDLSQTKADRVAALKSDGLETIRHQARLYPQAELMAGVVGFVNADRLGQGGVEASQEILLRPRATDPYFRDDLRVRLTLDARLQRVARKILQETVTRVGAKRGALLAMDARDGAMLAWVVEPSFDPNRYNETDLERLKNWAISDWYEPGSTFKPLNVAIALETGAARPDDSFYDAGRIQIGEWPVQNFDYNFAGARGPQTVTEILRDSSNVGMVRLMQEVDRQAYYEWLQKLGIGDRTGIDLPFEISGQLKSEEQFVYSPIEAATAAFGQGFTLTPIQMLQLQAILANGGYKVTPYTLVGLFDSRGRQRWQGDRGDRERIFSETTTRQVIDMMEEVVRDGTGTAAQIPGYRIAGKTGTAQKVNPNTGSYSTSASIVSFVGILPAEDPRYVVLAVIDEPDGGTGGSVAAPAVRSLIEALIAIENIPPSAIAEE